MNLKSLFKLNLFILFLGLFAQTSLASIECQKDNEDLRAMPLGMVEFTRVDGSKYTVQVRVADNSKTRSAGFQYVCAETIAQLPILFLFESVVRPSFHMNNVVAGIDIAFIRPDNTIDSIQKMHPYVLIMLNKPLYSPSSDVIAALEAHPGFYQKNNIDLTAKVSWQKAE